MAPMELIVIVETKPALPARGYSSVENRFKIGGSGRLRGGSRGVGGITRRGGVGKSGGGRLRDAGRVSRSFSS